MSSQLLPQSRVITENLMCSIPTYLGAIWGLVSVPLNSKLKLKSSWNAYCSCRGTIYIYMFVCVYIYIYMGFPHSSIGKESACNAGDPGSIPGSGRSPGEENGNPLQYFCLENPMNREAWQCYSLWGNKSRTRLSD